MVLQIDDMFLEKPHLRKYFYEQVPLGEHDPLYAEAESAAAKVIDVLEHLLWQATLFPNLYVHEKGKSIWDTKYQWFIDMFVSFTHAVSLICA